MLYAVNGPTFIIHGAPKSNLLVQILYLWSCSRVFHQIYSVYRWGL